MTNTTQLQQRFLFFLSPLKDYSLQVYRDVPIVQPGIACNNAVSQGSKVHQASQQSAQPHLAAVCSRESADTVKVFVRPSQIGL